MPTGSIYTRQAHCRVCQNTNLIPVLDLGTQSLTGRFPKQDQPDPPAGPLELVMCDRQGSKDACGLVQLAHTCDLSLMYGAEYGYRSSITATMVGHLHRTADRVTKMANVQKGDAVLEIGSNDGTLQKHLAGRGLKLVAIDPSAAKHAAGYPSDTTLIVDFFSSRAVRAGSTQQSFKAIISLAMFYDLERPLEFMKEIRELLDRDGIWCFEQAYLPTLLTSLCYDSICHEHLCYYSLGPIAWMAKRAGLRLIDVVENDVNGGSFAVIACRDDSARPANEAALSKMLAAEEALGLRERSVWEKLNADVSRHRETILDFFQKAAAANELVLGLGASTKGNVILQYCDIDRSMMPAIGERDLLKVGLRTPRNNIPIISEDEARGMNPKYFYVSPWHFRDEIVAREHAFLERGGKIVLPLPKFEIVAK